MFLKMFGRKTKRVRSRIATRRKKDTMIGKIFNAIRFKHWKEALTHVLGQDGEERRGSLPSDHLQKRAAVEHRRLMGF